MADCFCLNKSLFDKEYSKILKDGYLAEKTRYHVSEVSIKPIKSLQILADSSTEVFVEYLCEDSNPRTLCAVSQLSAPMTNKKLLDGFQKLFNECPCDEQ